MRPLRTSLFARPALMVACASEPPPPVRAPAPQVAPTPTPFGDQCGPAGAGWKMERPGASGRRAGPGMPQALHAAAMTGNGGRAALTFHRGDTLEGSITADASMAANGTFQGRRMSGEASRQGCIYNLSLTKR